MLRLKCINRYLSPSGPVSMSPSKFSVPTHINDEPLERYLLGGLQAEDLSAVESHLIDCASGTSRLCAAVGFPFLNLRNWSGHLGNYEGTEKRREHRIHTEDSGQLQAKIPIQMANISQNQFAARGTIVQVVFKRSDGRRYTDSG